MAALAIAATLFVPATARAHDHVAPDAWLVTGMGTGAGTNYTATWSEKQGDLCATLVGDGIRSWSSPPVPWVPGTEMAVRFESRHKPSSVRPIAYLIGDPLAGVPIFGEIMVPYELRRVEVDGKKMWEAVLFPPPSLDLYLDVVARWKDQSGCGTQQASWTFRAGLLPI